MNQASLTELLGRHAARCEIEAAKATNEQDKWALNRLAQLYREAQMEQMEKFTKQDREWLRDIRVAV